MTNAQFPSTALRNALMIAGLIAGLGLQGAQAAPDDTTTPAAHSDSVGAAIDDAAITTKIKVRMMGDDALKNSHIEVTTTNGVVTLNGSASSSSAKSVAEKEVLAIEGVKSVDNQLSVPASTALGAKTDRAVAKTERVVADSWITAKVKSSLLDDSISKGMDVKVDTVHGVVVLTGSVDSHQAVEHVKAIAEEVDGVKSVDTSALIVARK